jgi:hypothetical protein
VTDAASHRFAIAYTVKNEAGLLPDAIAYHLALGCARIYVFFDGTTDNSRELIEDSKRVLCAPSVDPASLADTPLWVDEILPRWQESMDVRKRINTYIAARQARDEGIEWLINIDPDELLLLNGQSDGGPGEAGGFFSSVSERIDQILLPNLEAIPVGEGSGRPFLDCTLFLRRFPLTEWLWKSSSALLRRLAPFPKLQAWYDYWFYRYRFGGALPRLMRHPVSGERIPAGYFLGYSNHKSFIRTRVSGEFSFNIHRWQKLRRRPRSIKKGYLLHYDLCSAEYFCDKFRQRQPAMLVKAFYCRYMFARIARDLPFETVREFFLKYICISSAAVLRRLRERGIVTEISFISHQMKQRVTRQASITASVHRLSAM